MAKREFVTQVRTRSFLIGTAVIIAVLAGYVRAAVLFCSTTSGATSSASAGRRRSSRIRCGTQAGVRHRRRHGDVTTDEQAAEQQVRDGDARRAGHRRAAGAAADRRKISGDDLQQRAERRARAQQVLNAQLAEAGIDPAAGGAGRRGRDGRRAALEPATRNEGSASRSGVIVGRLLYYSLLVYGTMVAQGVVEEKSSRVVEILLATVRPWQLLLGKVIGLGAVGLLQLLVISTVGLGLSSAPRRRRRRRAGRRRC